MGDDAGGPPRNAPIAFIDLHAQRRRLGDAVDDAIRRVLDHGAYIMGPEVAAFESELAGFCGAAHAVSCANGTDALTLVLMAKGVKPRDAVFCPAFTFAATAEAIVWSGATPVFVDVLADTFNVDPASLEAAIRLAKDAGLAPRGVIPVDLFGQPADYDAIEAIAKREGLWVLCDAAQSFGARYKSRKVGAIGTAATTSFFPSKPLGCYGDGGAVLTGDGDLAAVLRSLRAHGQGAGKHENVRIGMNSRLDTIQAAILLEKLKTFPEEIEARNQVAARYNDALGDLVAIPRVVDGATSVWAQYTIRPRGADRDALRSRLKSAGVPTAVYYPTPLHRQAAYKDFPRAGDLPVATRVSSEVVSLPMHAYLTIDEQAGVIDEVRAAITALDRQRT